MIKPTIVLIPGLLCDHTVWQYQTAVLQQHANIIIPDTTQFNNSDDLIEHILAISPPQFYLAGHSMGGWLALELMRKHSERVLKLCILATSAALDSAKKMRLRKRCLTWVSTVPLDELAENLAGLYVSKPVIKPIVDKMFRRNFGALATQQQANIQRRCCEDILQTITVPTTVLVGKEDKEFYKSTIDIANHIPNARLIVLENCGHMIMIEQPDDCTAAMLDWFL